MGTGSFPGVKCGRGVTLTTHRLLVTLTWKSRAIPLLPLLAVRPVQSLSACTVQLYLYSPYWPYSLYRASVPVQYSYTSTPPIGRTACTEPQCLYRTSVPVQYSYTSTPPNGRTACTDRQCLDKGALYHYLLTKVIYFALISHLFIALTLGVAVVAVAAQISRHLLLFACRLMSLFSFR